MLEHWERTWDYWVFGDNGKALSFYAMVVEPQVVRCVFRWILSSGTCKNDVCLLPHFNLIDLQKSWKVRGAWLKKYSLHHLKTLPESLYYLTSSYVNVAEEGMSIRKILPLSLLPSTAKWHLSFHCLINGIVMNWMLMSPIHMLKPYHQTDGIRRWGLREGSKIRWGHEWDQQP